MKEIIIDLKLVLEVIACLGVLITPLGIAWIRSTIDERVRTLREKSDVYGERIAVLEFQLSVHAPTLHDLPRVVQMIEQQRGAQGDLGDTLTGINRTLAKVGERLARIEERMRISRETT